MTATTTTRTIIELAAARGSSATTRAGARRYLLAHLPGTLPGLVFGRDRDRGAYNYALPSHQQPRRMNRAAWYAAQHARRIEARADRIAAALGMEPKATVEARLASTLAAAWPYRQSESRWAGGEHRVAVAIGPYPSADCVSERAWSDNGKWSGSNSAAALRITYGALNLLGEDGILVAGLITLDAEQVGPREYRATWAKQSRGVSLTTQTGWIIRGYHSTAATLAAARKQAAKARAEAVRAALAVRARRHAEKQQASSYRGVWVSLDDSLAAGNCRPASEQVRARVTRALGGEVYAVRGDVLLGLVTASERSRALRAIETAASRHAA